MWNVLLVEDELPSRDYIKHIIPWEQHGFAITGEAGNGLEALEAIEKQKPDLVISDIIMPHMDGVQLLKTARERDYDGVFVMLTCVSDFAYAQQALEYGASGYLLKLSMGPDTLAATLAKASRELRRREQLRRLLRMVPDFETAMEEGLTDHPEINKILLFMRSNFDKPLTLQAMAQYVSMAQSYLSDLFKKKTGDNLIPYLQKLRVREAELLLRTSQLPVSEIGEKVGFENFNYFIKIFKKWTGQTPAEYRKHNKTGR